MGTTDNLRNGQDRGRPSGWMTDSSASKTSATSRSPRSAAAAPVGSRDPPADIDELVAPLRRATFAAGVRVTQVASAEVVDDLETETSSRPGAAGADVEPDAQPPRRGHTRVARGVDVPSAAALAKPSTPAPNSTVAHTWRGPRPPVRGGLAAPRPPYIRTHPGLVVSQVLPGETPRRPSAGRSTSSPRARRRSSRRPR